MENNRATRELEWIKHIRKISKEITNLNADFMRHATNYRCKIEMENYLSYSRRELDKFIEGIFAGEFQDKE